MGNVRYLFGIILLVFLCAPFPLPQAAATGEISPGATLPEFQMVGLTSKADQEYLGLKDSDPFTLGQIAGKLVIMDFVSAL